MLSLLHVGKVVLCEEHRCKDRTQAGPVNMGMALILYFNYVVTRGDSPG